TGQLYQCAVNNSSCQPIPLQGGSGEKMGVGGTQDNTSLGCTGNINQESWLPPQTPPCFNPLWWFPTECLKGSVDLVFLFDGSGSMNDLQFNAIKEFMIDVMEKLGNTSVHFAAVQFSLDVKTEFDFNDYKRNPNPRMLLQNVMHMKSLTHTYKAITFVANQVFTPERGARDEATRVMIIITDGDPTDSGNVLAAKEKNIVRYIIGLGNNFDKSKDTLKDFASEPTSQFVKILDSFEKLKGLFSEIQEKIYAIEGTSQRSSFHLELSSSGFSVDLSKHRVVMGAVGADDWAGGLIELQDNMMLERFIGSLHMPLVLRCVLSTGYAVKSMQHQNKTLYAVGAPRYQHTGMVVVFEIDPNSSNWTEMQHIKGEQIGSYFGAVLCSVDVDGDGDTDVLLVGAPLYYEERRGGQVHIYRWGQAGLTSTAVLHGVMGNPLGRFGAAVTALADLNGDGWADVAVGAPLESEEQGAVYIYNGHHRDLNTHYSQRIEGTTVSPGVKYFGQSIHGQMDLSGDGLTDVTIGALGQVVMLRSRPILTVVPTVQFSPKEIPVKQVVCSGSDPSGQRVNLKVCFNASQDTRSYQGQGWDPNYLGSLPLKPIRSHPSSRAGPRSRTDLALTFCRCFLLQIPFEKNCGEDEVCEADLQIFFHQNTYGTMAPGCREHTAPPVIDEPSAPVSECFP
uniref:Integrin subunit alpha L n=1 Tax=Pelusios castaneus TaxID=367368 RepID=A0A8C8VJC9_9SAUR